MTLQAAFRSPRGRRTAFIPLLILLLLPALPASAAQSAATDGRLEKTCRLNGITEEEPVGRIRLAFARAVEAGVPEAELHPFLEEILRHRLDCGQAVRVLTVTSELRRRGLPYYVVFSKVREGMAKEAPPARVADVAEAKLTTLSASRDVLESLRAMGYRVRDFQNAAMVLSSYIEKGYTVSEIVSQIGEKGIQGAGFAALSGLVEKTVKRKERRP